MKSDFQSGNFHSFAFVPPKAAHRSSKILSSLSSLSIGQRERDFCHGGAEISREGEEVREEEEKEWREREKEGRDPQGAINLRNASLPLDLSRSNISPVLIRPKRQASTRCRSLSRRLFGDLIFRGETNDATEDTTCRDDSSVFTNAQRITRKLSSREPLDNREEGNGAKGMERAEGEEERERGETERMTGRKIFETKREGEEGGGGGVWFSAVLCNNVPFRDLVSSSSIMVAKNHPLSLENERKKREKEREVRRF